MIIYEVRISLEPAIAEPYRAWLEPHIREVLGIAGFTGAELLREDDDTGPVLVVRYHVASRDALTTYLRDHAARLRQDGLAKFGGRFTATRRVHELVRSFP